MLYIPRIFAQLALLAAFLLGVVAPAGAETVPGAAVSAVNPPSAASADKDEVAPGYFGRQPSPVAPKISPADVEWGGAILWLIFGGAGLGLAFWLIQRSRKSSARLEVPRRVVPASPAKSASKRAPQDCVDSVDESRYWIPLDQATTVTVDEITSVEEEAEYFMLLGRMDMAIGVLRHYIEANDDAPAHIWLNLLDILHSQGLRQEFEKLIPEISQRFNVALPSWEEANVRSHQMTGLEHFPHLFEKITSYWNRRGCLDYLRSLTEDNRNGERAGFNLEAFREILMLIGVLENKLQMDTPQSLAA